MKIVTIAVILTTFACAVEPQRTIEAAARCTQEDEDNGNCPGNGGGGSTPSDPPPDPLDVPRDQTEADARSHGYVGWSPTERAMCGTAFGGSVCRYKVKLSAGAAGSYECDLVCVADNYAHEECSIVAGSCHLL